MVSSLLVYRKCTRHEAARKVSLECNLKVLSSAAAYSAEDKTFRLPTECTVVHSVDVPARASKPKSLLA